MSIRSRITLLALLLLSACAEDPSPAPPVPTGIRGVYILNEGNFQRGNATLSWFLPDSGVVYNDIFRSVNGRDLGDVGNSITLHDGYAFLVINNSDRIEIVAEGTHASTGTVLLPVGSSPRNLTFDATGTGYVSNLMANTVTVLEPGTHAIRGHIAVGANPEGIVHADGAVFVANSGLGAGSTVSVINAASGVLETTLRVGDNPTAVAPYGAHNIVVLCTGAYNDFNDPTDDTPGKLIFIDTRTRTVSDSMVLGGHPQRLATDTSGHLYTVDGDIVRITPSGGLVEHSFIPGTFYSVAVDAGRALIYTTDALDYVQAGRLCVYSLTGEKRAEYRVGVIPGAMAVQAD
jgi:DNA-binding beta-propeller fold protein YncE